MTSSSPEWHNKQLLWVVHAENGCLQVRVCATDEQAHDVKSLPVKAGTAIIMSDRLLHCSSANMSKYTRRAWMPQFSKTSVLSNEDSVPVSFAVPIIAAWRFSPHGKQAF